MNKFFLLLLIGGLATAYYLLTRPVPPELTAEQAPPAPRIDLPVGQAAAPAPAPSVAPELPQGGNAAPEAALPPAVVPSGDSVDQGSAVGAADDAPGAVLGTPGEAPLFRTVEETIEAADALAIPSDPADPVAPALPVEPPAQTDPAPTLPAVQPPTQ